MAAPVFYLFAAKAAAGAFVAVRCSGGYGVGREKLPYGEVDAAEDAAGIFAAGNAAGALLFRHTVVVHGDQQLGIPFQTDNGELTEGDVNSPVFTAAGKLAAKAAADEAGDLAQLAVPVTAAALVHQPGVQHQRFHCLHHGNRQIALAHELEIRFPGAGLGGEDLGAALAAKEDGPLIKDTQALDGHRRGAAEVGLEGNGVEKPHIHAVEAPIKADGLHVHVDIEELGSTAFHR